MKQATFYLLSELQSQDPQQWVAFCCDLVSQAYSQGQRIFVFCPQQGLAEQLDEMLWQQPPENFIPHNLQGEGSEYGSPVEIGTAPSKGRRDLLICMADTSADFSKRFSHLIDFVPTEETAKAAARERYKSYRQLGFELTTQPVTE